MLRHGAAILDRFRPSGGVSDDGADGKLEGKAPRGRRLQLGVKWGLRGTAGSVYAVAALPLIINGVKNGSSVFMAGSGERHSFLLSKISLILMLMRVNMNQSSVRGLRSVSGCKQQRRGAPGPVGRWDGGMVGGSGCHRVPSQGPQVLDCFRSGDSPA